MRTRPRSCARRSPGRAKDLGALRQAIEKLHLGCSSALTSADFRLEKAFTLGHALAETSLLPEDRGSFDRAFGPRIVSIKNWLADLASVLPPHPSRAVALSLRTWESWAAEPTQDGEPIAWPKQGAGVRAALRRQGELWRALLAAEKSAPDMLDTNHYLRAASALVAALNSSIWRFLRPLAIPLAVAILLLGGGVALLLLTGTAGQVVGAIAAAAGAVGITGAGLRARLGKRDHLPREPALGRRARSGHRGGGPDRPDRLGRQRRPGRPPPDRGATSVATNIETLGEFRDAVRASTSRSSRSCSPRTPSSSSKRSRGAVAAPSSSGCSGRRSRRGSRPSRSEWWRRGPATWSPTSNPVLMSGGCRRGGSGAGRASPTATRHASRPACHQKSPWAVSRPGRSELQLELGPERTVI